MVIQGISVGDILLLSQQAFRIGRAFSQGANSAPAEFAEVEREADGLGRAFRITADTLDEDDSILSRADPETRSAVETILESAERTLDNLESFVKSYQVIRKRYTENGLVAERSWSEAFMAKYKTVKWTTEGGNIRDLRNVLHVHTNTINLTMQALQSRSLSRLERTVIPMAENIASIHQRVNGDIGDKIDELHALIMSLANGTPSLNARSRVAGESSMDVSRLRSSSTSTFDRALDIGGPRIRQTSYSGASSCTHVRHEDRSPHDSVRSMSLRISDQPYDDVSGTHSSSSGNFENGSVSPLRCSLRGAMARSPDALNGRSFLAPSTPSLSRQTSGVPRRESATLPTLSRNVSEDDTFTGSSQYPGIRQRQLSEPGISAISEIRRHLQETSNGQPELPPPAIPERSTEQRNPATPSSLLATQNIIHSNSNTNTVGLASHTESAAFEEALFRNAIILCDIHGKLVEYLRHKPDEPDPRFDTEMIEVCSESRICVIRKKENLAHGGTTAITSIWALSKDGSVRTQQKLPDVVETVPYCSYFEPEKISLGGADMALKYHGKKWGDVLDQEIKTSWMNYIFHSEDDAAAFQSAVFGRSLVGSFRTVKTTVIHPGIMGTFAFEEQFANIEMLRLWQTDGVSTSDPQGGVFVLMHFSSNFGEGWARWWMNNSMQQVRITSDGSKFAKVKGIDIGVAKPGNTASTAQTVRRSSTGGSGSAARRVTGVKIEFQTEKEKDRFIQLSRKVQENMLRLPAL